MMNDEKRKLSDEQQQRGQVTRSKRPPSKNT